MAKYYSMKIIATNGFKILIVTLLFATMAFINLQNEHIDYVPDAETAKKIAEAVWFPIYGKSILDHKPYNAELKNGLWVVTGTIGDELGGVAYIEIQKKDCKILKVTHGK